MESAGQPFQGCCRAERFFCVVFQFFDAFLVGIHDADFGRMILDNHIIGDRIDFSGESLQTIISIYEIKEKCLLGKIPFRKGEKDFRLSCIQKCEAELSQLVFPVAFAPIRTTAFL